MGLLDRRMEAGCTHLVLDLRESHTIALFCWINAILDDRIKNDSPCSDARAAKGMTRVIVFMENENIAVLNDGKRR